MSYLVYGVLNGHRFPARPSVKGVHNQTVWVLNCGDLCAALSDAEPRADSATGKPRDVLQKDDLLAYAGVIEASIALRRLCRCATEAFSAVLLRCGRGHAVTQDIYTRFCDGSMAASRCAYGLCCRRLTPFRSAAPPADPRPAVAASCASIWRLRKASIASPNLCVTRCTAGSGNAWKR